MSKILQLRGLHASTSKVFLDHYSFFLTENFGNIIPFLLKIIVLPMQLFWVQTAVDCHLGSALFACASICLAFVCWASYSSLYLPTSIYGEYNTFVGAELHIQREKRRQREWFNFLQHLQFFTLLAKQIGRLD